MMKKDVGLFVKVITCFLLMLCLLFVPSCKKSPSEPSGDSSTGDWVPIDIKLPKPVFIGTPQDTRVPNLEKPLGKDRAPFPAPEGTKNVAFGKPVSSSDEVKICTIPRQMKASSLMPRASRPVMSGFTATAIPATI